jgi:hypothetical protein
MTDRIDLHQLTTPSMMAEAPGEIFGRSYEWHEYSGFSVI